MVELTWLETNNLPPKVYMPVDQVPDLTPTPLFKQGCWHRGRAVTNQRDGDTHISYTPSLKVSGYDS